MSFDKIESVLGIIADNGHFDTGSLKSLCYAKLIPKEQQILAWRKRHEVYLNKKQLYLNSKHLHYYQKPEEIKQLCISFKDLNPDERTIRLTDIKRHFPIEENDIPLLRNVFLKGSTAYFLEDLINMLYEKYGFEKAREIYRQKYTFHINKKHNHQERQETVDKLVDKIVDKYFDKYIDIFVSHFVENGDKINKRKEIASMFRQNNICVHFVRNGTKKKQLIWYLDNVAQNMIFFYQKAADIGFENDISSIYVIATEAVDYKNSLCKTSEVYEKYRLRQMKKIELLDALKTHNLKVRNDSKLFKDYVSDTPGTQRFTCDDVVERLIAMAFLRKYTPYGRIMNTFYNLRKQPSPSWYVPLHQYTMEQRDIRYLKMYSSYEEQTTIATFMACSHFLLHKNNPIFVLPEFKTLKKSMRGASLDEQKKEYQKLKKRVAYCQKIKDVTLPTFLERYVRHEKTLSEKYIEANQLMREYLLRRN